MPLRYVDPNKKRFARKAFAAFIRSPAGEVFVRYVAAPTDPWLERVTGGRVNWGAGIINTSTLRTTGAKSGQPRESQITYFHDGRDPIVIASNYGKATHPNWYRNLVAQPECEFGGEPFRAVEVTDPGEYERLYALAEQVYSGYHNYRDKARAAGRHIPVLRLESR
jgi:deazaflavin-dependent oxidoreductase (nitroreductase family)